MQRERAVPPLPAARREVARVARRSAPRDAARSGGGKRPYTLVAVDRPGDILPRYRGTPVERLLRYHELHEELGSYEQAQVLVGMCMDHRKALRMPARFAYVLRTGAANLRRVEFKVSFAVAIGRVQAICLIGHTHCGMFELKQKRDEFVRGLAEHGGWTERAAAEHFDDWSSTFEIDDPAQFVAFEADRLSRRYPKVLVAPLLYDVDTGRILQIVPGRVAARGRRTR